MASTDFTYNTRNRLTNIDHKQGTTVLASYAYSFDDMGRITSVDSSADGVTNYTFDKVSQVTAADHTGQTDETYSFDSNGNRSTYSIDTNNLTTSDGTYNYAYDNEGNRTTKTKISDGTYTSYTWDYRNRLTAVKDYSSSSVLLKETTYAYDAHNRLIKSTYDADGAGAGAATARYWAFDEGINPLLEFKSGSASDASHRYLWGAAVDQLFADEQPTSTSAAGNVLWALGDNLGTIRDIADLSGSTTSVTNHRRFGAYGNLVSESNSAVDMLFGFTGKLYDENVKLQNNLNRWYDAAVGQWMSEDPLVFKAGDENLRRYVGNGPLSRIDPNGLADPQLARNTPTIAGQIADDAQYLGTLMYAWQLGGAQGVLNTANGLTDVGVSMAKAANPAAPLLNMAGIDPYANLKIDWSKDALIHESGDGWWDDTHGWSKWAGSQGVLAAAGAYWASTAPSTTSISHFPTYGPGHVAVSSGGGPPIHWLMGAAGPRVVAVLESEQMLLGGYWRTLTLPARNPAAAYTIRESPASFINCWAAAFNAAWRALVTNP